MNKDSLQKYIVLTIFASTGSIFNQYTMLSNKYPIIDMSINFFITYFLIGPSGGRVFPSPGSS